MYSSGYYKDKVNKYTNVKNQLLNAITYFENTEDVLTKAQEKLEKIILGTKVINTEVVSTEVSNLNSLTEAIKQAKSECNQKISENNLLYLRALAAENEKLSLEVETDGN